MLRATLLVIALVGSQWATGANYHINLVEVTHDGFCFYRAVERALGQSGDGRALFSQLTGYLQNASPFSHPMLEAHLSDAVVGSSIDSLTARLISTSPTLANRDSWAGMPELVAMAHHLNQPILVWHVNQNLEVDDHSLLVTPEQVLPVFSIDDDSGMEIPDIQLVHVGSEWWWLETRDSLQSWSIGWSAYRNQMAGVLHDRLMAGHTGQVLAEAGDDSSYHVWVYLPDTAIPDDLLILDRSSITALQRMLFAASWRAWMQLYTDMKIELKYAVADADSFILPDYQWAQERYDRVVRAMDNGCRILVSGAACSTVGNAMNDYLLVAGESLKGFMRSILPARCGVWDTLSKFRPVIDMYVQNYAGLTFCGLFAAFLKSTQLSDVTPSNLQLQFPHLLSIRLPSGQQHPAQISFSPGSVTIPFDVSNPLHHILFSLYITARSYQLANQCLRISLRFTDDDLSKLLGRYDEPAIKSYVEAQMAEYSKILLRIRAVIHALGFRYYPEFWQSEHYQAITICDGRSIVFHSDDFQPRDGWHHLQPPSQDKQSK
ncbi:hypothetical protein GZ77_09715 [Endozoicomonas montiporae]|uniref:OTU domain-containing protein n=1 Tax=Endozoicomonas montiporae TaxID=1027273 RepID=A0A081N818_9GAMM|nr:OTU domain-containing protein [Endozoicomonas montiporae]KEQ14591.1 hypothetical protein GZ77_09715 [Endozoicomonas montiporae]